MSAEPPPPAHTQPSFLLSVQADFPTKDVPAIWQAMQAEYPNKPQRLTEATLRRWAETETVKLRKYVNHGAPQPAQDGPPGWRETEAYKNSVFAIKDGAMHADTWRGVSPDCRDAVLAEKKQKGGQ